MEIITALDALKEWDKGETLFSIELGGSGPTKLAYTNMLVGHGFILNNHRTVGGVIIYEKGVLPEWMK